MMLHHYNCLLFIIILLVTEYALDGEENIMRKERNVAKDLVEKRLSVMYTSALQPVCTVHPRVHQNMRGVHH